MITRRLLSKQRTVVPKRRPTHLVCGSAGATRLSHMTQRACCGARSLPTSNPRSKGWAAGPGNAQCCEIVEQIYESKNCVLNGKAEGSFCVNVRPQTHNWARICRLPSLPLTNAQRFTERRTPTAHATETEAETLVHEHKAPEPWNPKQAPNNCIGTNRTPNILAGGW